MKACQRCGSKLIGGLCSDKTCPFSDCDQADLVRGFTGHPEVEALIQAERGRVFHKTTFRITVLSEEPFHLAPTDEDPFDLQRIDYSITEGHCLGNVEELSSEEVTQSKIETECKKLGNDGSFFLDEDGDND